MKRSKMTRQNVFFIWSAILAVSMVLAVIKDFQPEWKKYQTRFRDLTVERAEKEIASENEKVEKVYKAKIDELDKRIRALKDEAQTVNRHSQIAAQEKVIAELTLKEAGASQKLSFAKSLLGMSRSKYEFQKNDPYANTKNVEKLKAEYEKYFKEVQELTPPADAAYAELTKAKEELKELQKGASDLEREREKIVAEMEQWRAEVEKIRPSSMVQYTANTIRDLPLLDFIDPKYKLQQIVLNDLPDITHSAKVDRCITCHVGITDPRYQDAALDQPYRAHPKLDLYVGPNSPHPVEKFGCTTCHLGRGYGTTFELASHSPNDEKQAAEWKKKYGWAEMHYWDYPMLPKKNMEAMCVTCHPSSQELRMAKQVFEGRQIYERRGCHGCHKIEGVSDINGVRDMARVGPSLKRVASKLDPEWTARWIEDPGKFYDTAKMPDIFGHQIPSKETFPEYVEHLEHENPKAMHDLEGAYKDMKADDAVMIDAINTWLYANTDTEFEAQLAEPPSEPGDAANGKELFKVVNCLGCHSQKEMDATGQGYAPDLSKIGSKTSRKWLYNWLKNPNLYWPDTKMPNPRLTEQEANDITAYLLTLKDDAFMAAAKPVVDSKRLEEVAVKYARAKLSEADAVAQIAAMDENQRKLYVGEETIYRRGCFGCHEIKGFEDRPRIGAELTSEGYKEIELFDFGMHKYVHVPHNRHSWIENKVRMPYSYFLGAVSNPFEQSFYMPWFRFSEDEAAKITTFILGQTGKTPPEKYRYDLVGDVQKKQVLREGRKAIERKNCTGCHPIGLQWSYVNSEEIPERTFPVWTSEAIIAKHDPNLPEGKFARLAQDRAADVAPNDKVIIPEHGFIQGETVFGEDYFGVGELFAKEPVEINVGADNEIRIPLERPASLRVYGNDEAHIYKYYEEVAKAPPVLRNEGAKVNPEWFFKFLKNIETIRTHIDVRMPQWEWTDAEATAVVRYFAAAAGEQFPYQTVDLSPLGDPHKKTTKELFGLPGSPEYSTSLQCLSCHPSGGLVPSSPKDNWGPNLYLAQERLKVPFIKSWLRDPGSWSPGTRMPKFFYDRDGDKVIEVRPGAEKEITNLAEMIHYLPQIDEVKLAAAMAQEFAPAAPAHGAAEEENPAAPAEDDGSAGGDSADEEFSDPAAPAPADAAPAPAPADAPPASDDSGGDFDN